MSCRDSSTDRNSLGLLVPLLYELIGRNISAEMLKDCRVSIPVAVPLKLWLPHVAAAHASAYSFSFATILRSIELTVFEGYGSTVLSFR
jgi:hypothetical protein